MKGWLAPQKISDHLAGRDNNLNLIRMIAATAVLVSHAFPIALGQGTVEPLKNLTGMTLGGFAVAIFFALSGLLITRSFGRKSSLVHFTVARVLRLFPALLVVLVLTTLAGAAFTQLSVRSYFLATETLTYIPRNLSLAFLQYSLPGVFNDNIYGDAINGSLWTLVYEVVCYFGVVIAGVIGLLKHPRAFSLVFIILSYGYLFGLGWEPTDGILRRLDLLLSLAFPFALGMMAYIWRDRFVLDLRIAAVLWLLCIPAVYSSLLPAAVLIAVIYSITWLAFIPKGPLLQYNRLGDYSYGIYIFAFPVQQAMAFALPSAGPWTNMAVSAPVTLLFAVLSWHLIESKALAKVSPVGDWVSERLAFVFLQKRRNLGNRSQR